MATSKRNRRLSVTAVIVAGYIAATIAAKRRGYRFGRNTLVRCRQSHLYTTFWIPGGSLKALRLGPWRVQWCPVGRHVDLVHPVKDADITDAEREFAASHHDVMVPLPVRPCTDPPAGPDPPPAGPDPPMWLLHLPSIP